MKRACTKTIVAGALALALPACAPEGRQECYSYHECSAGEVCVNSPSHPGYKSCHPPSRLGEPCDSAEDCVGSLVCSADEAVCMDPLPEGAECLAGECETGLECAWPFACEAHGSCAGLGITGTCLVPGAEGTHCYRDYRGFDDCDGDLVCGSESVCRVLGEEGEPCGANRDCASELACLWPSDPQLTCLPKAAEGEACGLQFQAPPCLDDLRCNVGLEPATCAPPQPEGGPCNVSADRADSLLCVRLPESASCQLPGEEGAPCSENSHCAATLECNPYEEPWACRGPGLEGDQCGFYRECSASLTCNTGYEPFSCREPGGEGAPCGWADDCLPGLRCVAAGDTGFCLPLAGAGEDCAWPQDCADGLFCYAVTGTCHPGTQFPYCHLNKECTKGQVCNWAFDTCTPLGRAGGPCAYYNECQDGLFCDCPQEHVPGHCWPLPGEWEPCAAVSCGDGWKLACADGTDCHALGYAEVCVPRPGPGEPCDELGLCGLELVCNEAFDPPECRPPGLPDDLCARSADCAFPFQCLEAAECQALPGSGAPCTTDSSCPEGLFCNTEFTPDACLPPGPAGTPCAQHEACLSGLCMNTTYYDTESQFTCL